MSFEKVGSILRDADKNGYGVLAFNCFNYESIAWVIETAEEEKTPVIIMLYPSMAKHIPASTFAAITRDLAGKVKVPVGLHHDHSSSYEEILGAIRCGFTSVMIDGSALEYPENIRVTSEVVRAAHAMGVDVEAELGHVGVAANHDGEKDSLYTQPDKAAEFIERTGADVLAVAIGSAHGFYRTEPKLNLELLARIDEAVDVPLALHGGTGIPDDQIRKAVKLGIKKLNFGTGYFHYHYVKTKELIEEKKTSESMLDCLMSSRADIKEFIRARLLSVK